MGQRKEKSTVSTECLIKNRQLNTFSLKSDQRPLETVAVLKGYISCHFSTKHANYVNWSTQERTATAQNLAASLQDQQNTELFIGIQISKDQ